jgi:uncharacterized protein
MEHELRKAGTSGEICPLAARFCYYIRLSSHHLRPSRMPEKRSFLRLFTERGPLVAFAVAFLIGIAAPASAQFFNFGNFGGPPPPRPQPQQGGRGPGGWFGGDFFAPFQQQAPRPVENYSKAPPPPKRDTVAEHNVLVLGDAMADWLAYGLEDAYTEQPDMGVVRRHKTVSGLIHYQPKGDPADWAAAAKGILASEKPDVIVVMLGLNDRVSIREPEKAEKSEAKGGEKKGDKKEARKPSETKPDAKSDNAADTGKPEEKAQDAESDEADNGDTPQVMTPERGARAPNGLVEFHDERWVELYNKKIDEMIAVLKTKGVPVVWVGLPAVRGAKATADTLFLDSLYREASNKAGITYVDVWDGFVDEAGRFLQQGPDFEGQIRRLRSYDGVYFTKAGARKLAHYVEREITRLLASRSGPITLPSEPATPDANAQPGQPAPRPLAGPIVPLVASSVGTDQLLGGPGSRPAAVDALVARTLVKGEALTPPAGRADDFTWPRREVGREQAKGDTPVASASPDAAPGAPQPQTLPKSKRPANAQPGPAPQGASPSFRNFFGLGGAPPAPRQVQPRTAPGPAAPPRPPASVGRSASVPQGNVAQ